MGIIRTAKSYLGDVFDRGKTDSAEYDPDYEADGLDSKPIDRDEVSRRLHLNDDEATQYGKSLAAVEKLAAGSSAPGVDPATGASPPYFLENTGGLFDSAETAEEEASVTEAPTAEESVPNNINAFSNARIDPDAAIKKKPNKKQKASDEDECILKEIEDKYLDESQASKTRPADSKSTNNLTLFSSGKINEGAAPAATTTTSSTTAAAATAANQPSKAGKKQFVGYTLVKKGERPVDPKNLNGKKEKALMTFTEYAMLEKAKTEAEGALFVFEAFAAAEQKSKGWHVYAVLQVWDDEEKGWIRKFDAKNPLSAAVEKELLDRGWEGILREDSWFFDL